MFFKECHVTPNTFYARFPIWGTLTLIIPDVLLYDNLNFEISSFNK